MAETCRRIHAQVIGRGDDPVQDYPIQPVLKCLAGDDEETFSVGIFFNFTWDELSVLLSVDPQILYNTIRECGAEHFTLSSDAGEPLFPDSVDDAPGARLLERSA